MLTRITCYFKHLTKKLISSLWDVIGRLWEKLPRLQTISRTDVLAILIAHQERLGYDMTPEQQIAIFLKRIGELEREVGQWRNKYVRLRASVPNAADRVKPTKAKLESTDKENPVEATEASKSVKDVKATKTAKTEKVKADKPKEAKKSK